MSLLQERPLKLRPCGRIDFVKRKSGSGTETSRAVGFQRDRMLCAPINGFGGLDPDIQALHRYDIAAGAAIECRVEIKIAESGKRGGRGFADDGGRIGVRPSP